MAQFGGWEGDYEVVGELAAGGGDANEVVEPEEEVLDQDKGLDGAEGVDNQHACNDEYENDINQDLNEKSYGLDWMRDNNTQEHGVSERRRSRSRSRNRSEEKGVLESSGSGSGQQITSINS